MNVKILMISLFTMVLLSGARPPEKNYKLAVKFYQKGELNKALEHVNFALRKKRTSEAMWLKGHILASLGNHQNALHFLRYRLSAQPKDDNLTAIGDCHFELGNYEDALIFYRKVMNQGPIEYYNLSASFYKLNSNDSALFYLAKAIESEPLNAEFIIGRAIVYQDEMRMDCACQDYQLACDLGQESACAALESRNCLSWRFVWAANH